MTLRQAQLSSLDSVPESLREYASEGENGVTVNIPEDRDVLLVDKALWESRHKGIGDRDAEIRRLKADKKAAMEQLEALQAEHADAMSRLDSLGDDADIEKKVKAASEQKILQIAKQKDAEVAAAKQAYEEMSARAQKLAQEHEADLARAEVYSALAAAKAHSPEIVAPAVMRNVRVARDEDGNVIRKDGKAMLEVVVDGVVQVTGDGTPKSVADWVKGDFVSQHPMQFDGVVTAGGGSRGGGGRGVPGAASTNPLKNGDMLEFMRVSKSDPALAKRWADEVGFKSPAPSR